MKRKLRVLFYGVTHEHAAGKLNTLRALADDFEIAAVVDDRPRGTPRFIDPQCPLREEGLPFVAEDEAWKVPAVDIGFVETTNADLMGVAGEFIRRGIPIHCDKPCGEAMEPYRTLVETARAKNLPFQIGYMYRGNPALKEIWRLVRNGELGEIRFIEADMNHNYQAAGYEEYLKTFRGGIFYNLACHLVDMIQPLVKGRCTGVETHLKPTSGKALFRFGDTDVLLRTEAYMPGGILSRRLRVDGTKGTIDLCPIERFDGERLVYTISANKKVTPFDCGIQTDRYADQLLDLAAIVRGEKANDQDYDRDLLVHETLLEAIQ